MKLEWQLSDGSGQIPDQIDDFTGVEKNVRPRIWKCVDNVKHEDSVRSTCRQQSAYCFELNAKIYLKK